MNWNRGKNSSAEKAVNEGGNLNNELESRQELFGRENCASRNSIACWAWGGKLNNELDSKQ